MSDNVFVEQTIKDTWDLWGKALLDYHQNVFRPPFIWKRSDGLSSEASLAINFAGVSDWSLVEKAALERVHGRILDIGCGAGKHILVFQSQGYMTTGIDISPRAIAVCRDRGVQDAREMNTFSLQFTPNTFDCVTLFANGLSMGGTPQGICQLLSEIARVTSPNGSIVLTETDVSVTSNEAHLAYQRANEQAGRYKGQILMRQEYAGMTSEWFPWMFVSPSELSELAKSTGWNLSEVVNGVGGVYCAILTK